MLRTSKNEFIFSFSLSMTIFLFLYLHLSLEVHIFTVVAIILYYMGALLFLLKRQVSLNKILLLNTVKSTLFIVVFFPVIFYFIIIVFGPGLASHMNFNATEAFMFGHLSADEAYHVSLINSVKTIGYPSTGLDGYTPVPYHALTHYFDALLLWATKAHTLDMYGPLTLAKAILFLSAMMFFTVSECRSNHILAFLVHFCCSYTYLFYHGNVIGSYPLWMPSLLLILFWQQIKKIITTEISLETALLFVIFTTFLTFGKVSLGAAFLGTVGLTIILKNYSSVLAYISVFSAFVVFVAFGLLITKGLSHGDERASLGVLLHYSKPILEVLFPASCFCAIFPNSVCRKMIMPFLVYPFAMLLAALIVPIWYGDYTWFVEGYRYIVSVFILSDLGLLLTRKIAFPTKEQFNKWTKPKLELVKHVKKIQRISPILLITFFLHQSYNYFDEVSHKATYVAFSEFPYTIYNQYKDPNEPYRRVSVYKENSIISYASGTSQLAMRELLDFRAQLHDFKKLIKLNEAPVFLDQNTWKKIYDLKSKIGHQQGGIEDNWVNRLKFSAFLGIPLINGIPAGVEEHKWGIGFYDKEYFWTKDLSSPKCEKETTFIDVKFEKELVVKKSLCKPASPS